MNRKLWIAFFSIATALFLCACGTMVCSVAGLTLLVMEPAKASPADLLVSKDQGPVVEPIRRASRAAERETARQLVKADLPQRDLHDLAYRLQGIKGFQVHADSEAPPDYEPGAPLTFWIHDVRSNSFFTTTAILQYETPHAYWWVEEGYEIPEHDLALSAQRFEELTYPNNRRYFGSEWNPGIDADPHVYIFLGNVPGVGGYYSAPDEYPVEVRPHSNGHEMFYINLENSQPGNDYFDGILAHEFQHMIHWAMDRNEDTWVNEGLSELAAQINGYDVGGSDYRFSLRPDTQLNSWTELQDAGPHYGASYLFLAYFYEQYGQEAVRQLVAEPANGIAGFNAVLSQIDPEARDFHKLFADWLVANYLDQPSRHAGQYGYAKLKISQPRYAAHHGTYPAGRQAAVHQYAADYILLEGEGDLTVEFTGSRVVPLVGNETHSGEYQWWSNRGDDGDATLTRAFDLSNLEQATLQAWMWYDLEVDYDYAYVEVSTDGGQTWDILANEHTITDNPSGNSYGPALTGTSGDGPEPRWSLESFDLTPYAGQEVLVRFEVITDEALNRPGLVLDDISIPELGYSHDAEKGNGGWQAAGWLRVTDHIPQEWLVQLITEGRQTRVQRMQLDEQMQGKLTISGLGQKVKRAILVVSALAPATTEPAGYTYRLTED